MDIKNVTFIDRIIITSAYSKIAPESLSSTARPIGGIEKRIVALLDSIFSALSSSYREAKVKLSHQIMMEEASKKYASITTSTKTVFSKDKEKKEASAKPAQPAPVAKKEENIKEEDLNKGKRALEDKVNDAFFNAFELDDVDFKHLYEPNDDVEEYVQEDEFVEDFCDLFSELDTDVLTETNPECKKIAEEYLHNKAVKELHETVLKNPGALAGFFLFLQAHIANGGNAEDYLRTDESAPAFEGIATDERAEIDRFHEPRGEAQESVNVEQQILERTDEFFDAVEASSDVFEQVATDEFGEKPGEPLAN